MPQGAPTQGLLIDAGRGPMNRLSGAGPFMGGPTVALSTSGGEGTGKSVVAVETTIYRSHDTLPTREMVRLTTESEIIFQDARPNCQFKLLDQRLPTLSGLLVSTSGSGEKRVGMKPLAGEQVGNVIQTGAVTVGVSAQCGQGVFVAEAGVFQKDAHRDPHLHPLIG